MPIVLKSGSLNLLEPSAPVQACTGTAFLPGVKMSESWRRSFPAPVLQCGTLCYSIYIVRGNVRPLSLPCSWVRWRFRMNIQISTWQLRVLA